jgi:hypothetical protein
MTVVSERLNLPESEPLGIGEVRLVSFEHVHDRAGREYDVRYVRVGDESDKNPQLRNWYAEQGNMLERTIIANPQWEATTVKNGVVSVPENNLAAQWLYYENDGTPSQMLEWASKFPTAIALEPLQRLENGGKWFSSGSLDHRTLELFTYMIDGIGLRSRAGIYTQSVVEYAEKSNSDTLEIISLGSGASVPNIQATQQLEAHNKAVNWHFYDFDPEALMYAQKLVGEQKFALSTFDYGPEWINPETGETEPKGQNYLRAFRVENESVDIVDALGLFEYLKPKDATRFVHELFKKVKPGGSLIVSNMLPSREQREFNQHAVGWPGLYRRNEADLLAIVEAAGIDTKQVTMTYSEDGVYVVMEIKKL